MKKYPEYDGSSIRKERENQSGRKGKIYQEGKGSSTKRIMDNQQEIFPVVDEEGRVIGSATRGECHSGSMLLHPVVHLHVFNADGALYLQKRPMWKDIQPGKWDTAVGGHVDVGESPQDALFREVREELGITEFTPEFVDKYVFESAVERELVYVFQTTYDGLIQPSENELDGGRFWSVQEICEAMGRDVLTPNFEGEYQRFFCHFLCGLSKNDYFCGEK